MKAIKVFGIVVAAHAAIFLFVFAIPGCRSTGKQKPSSASAAEPSATPNYAASGPLATLPPPAAGDTGPFINAPVETVRFSPTRPGTPVAGALQAQPPADVTPAATYTVVKNDSLWTVAKKNNTTVRELAAANNIRQDAPLRLGQKLIIPGKAPTSAAASTSPAAPGAGAAAPAATLTYTVKAGDTLAVIARRAGTTVDAVKKLNKLRSDTVRAGQQLTLPAGGLAAAVTTPAPAPTNTAGARAGAGKHIVAPGETAGGIARRYGVKTSDLVVANNIPDPTRLRAGQELIIPGATTPAATNTPAPTPAPFDSPISPVTPTTAIESPVQPAAAPADSPFVTTPDSSAPMPVIKVDDAGAPKLQ